MTTTAELEAIEAEAAQGDDDDDDDEEGEAEPAAPEPDDEEGEAEAEEAVGLTPIGPDEIRKAERATDAQRRKLTSILGAEYVAEQCLLCSGLGFYPEQPPVGAALIVSTDDDGLTLEVQPPSPDIPLLAAVDKAMCSECDGYGEVLTGSKAPHGMVAPCSKCAGNGWVIVAREQPATADYFPPAVATPETVAAQAVNGLPDAWGRPSGHAHWGVPPASVAG